MSYYSKHAEEYIESTMGIDMSSWYAMLEPYLPLGGSILDVGLGSGRDMLHFKKKGYDVFGIDIEEAFVEHAKSLGLSAQIGDIRTYQTSKRFDGIWANACLVHLAKEQVQPAIRHLLSLLKPGGVLFVSMKKGENFEVDELGRPMLYVDESIFKPFDVVKMTFAKDASRPLTWIQVIIANKARVVC